LAPGKTCTLVVTCSPTKEKTFKGKEKIAFGTQDCKPKEDKLKCDGVAPVPTATATRTATATATMTQAPTQTPTSTPTCPGGGLRAGNVCVSPTPTPAKTSTPTSTVTSTSTTTPTPTATATPGVALWVTSGGVGLPEVNQVTAYPLPIGMNPDITPAVTIVGQFDSLCTSAGAPFPCCTGSGTGTCLDNAMLDIPGGIALDASGDLFVANGDNPSSVCTGAGTPFSCCTGSSVGTCGNSQCTAVATPFDCCIGSGTGNCFGNSINVFAPGSNGNVAPIRTISGGSTQLLLPNGLTLSGSSIFTANIANAMSQGGTGAVLAFPASGSGNIAPSVSIFTPKTAGAIPTFLLDSKGVALDSEGVIYVVNPDGPYITIYPAGSNGDVCPTGYTVGGGATECTMGVPSGILGCGAPTSGLCNAPDMTLLGLPYGIALDSAANIYVTNDGGPPGAVGPSVTIYAAGSSGNTAPLETIAGQSNQFCTGFATPYACCSGTAADPNSSCTASGMPQFCCSGPDMGTCTNDCVDDTKLSNPQGIALDSKGNIYVANFGNFTITEYPPFGGMSVGTVNQAPIATINTGFVGNSPTGLAVGPFTP